MRTSPSMLIISTDDAPIPGKIAIDDWKFADRAAFDAEMKLADATLSHHQLRSGPPSAELVGDARRLRTLADKHLSTAFELMKTGAAPAGRGPPLLEDSP